MEANNPRWVLWRQRLPAAEQMDDVEGHGAERADRKTDADQSEHDDRVQPRRRFAVEMMLVVEMMNRMYCRRHGCHPRQSSALLRRFFPSLHLTPDSVIPHRGPWQGSFATVAWLWA